MKGEQDGAACSIRVLTKLNPLAFTHSLNVRIIIFHFAANKVNAVNTNMFKPPVSELVKDIVRKNFTREIEFYEFCRQRLYKQYAALNLV